MKDFTTLWNERQEKKKSLAAQNTSGQNASGMDDFMALWNQRKQKRGNDNDLVQSYFAEVQQYQNRAKRDEGRLAYGNAASIRQTNADATSYLRSRGEHLKNYLLEKGYSPEDLDPVLLDIDRVADDLDVFDDYFSKVSTDYSRFDSQTAYNQAVNESNWYNTYGGKTAEELLADLDNLEKDSDEYNWVSGYYGYLEDQKRQNYDVANGEQSVDAIKQDLADYRTVADWYNTVVDEGFDPSVDFADDSRLAEYNRLYEKYGSVADLQRMLTAEEQQVNLAKRAQRFTEMSGVGVEGSANYDPEFAQKSTYQSTALESNWDKLWSKYSLGYGDLAYEFINNADPHIRNQIINHEKLKGLRGYERKHFYDWEALEKMTPEEVATYNYYYSTGGKDAADEYLDLIQEGLNMEVAKDIAAEMDTTSKRIGFAADAGLEGFAKNVKNLGSNADYITSSPVQLAAGLVREDLEGAGPKLPEWMGGASLGQAAFDVTQTTANIVPSVLASAAVSYVNPALGAWVGAGLMGASAAGGAYQEKINAGYSKESARAYSTMVGVSEAAMEKVLGGISTIGGSALKNISAIDNALGRFANTYAGQLLANGMSEFSEEFVQAVIEPYMWQAVSGEMASVDLEEAFYNAALGFATGVLFEAGTSTPGAVSNAIDTRNAGKSVINTKGGIESLNAAAASVSSTASPELQKQIAKAQEKASKGGARAVGQLYNAVSAEVTKADTADIVKSLNRKGIKGDVASKYADAIVARLSGTELTDYGKNIFDTAIRDKRVQTVVSDLIDNKMSTVGQRNQKLAAAIGKEASTIDVAKVKEQQRTEFVEENNEYDVAADQQTINTKTGATVKVNDIAEITDKGVVNVRLGDGSVVNAADLSYATEDISLAYSALKGKPMSAENANRLFKMSEGMDAAEFYEAVEDGYERGYANLAKPEGEVAAAAYEAGAAQRASEGGKEAKKTRKSGINRIGRDGSISVISADEDVSDKGFSKRQLPAVQTIQALEKLDLGTAFFVVESYKIKVNGETRIVFTDENGQVKDAPNGMYYKDGRVYIDINAGRGATGKFVLQTAAHELAHHIQQWNPSKYKVLADFLAAEYGKQGVDAYAAIKAKQQELSQIRGRSVSFNEAYHEWVADNLSVMFNDGNLYDKLVKLKHKDSALFNEIRKFVDDLAKRVRKAFGMDGAETREGKFVLSWDPRVIDRLQQIYAEALVESSERYAQAAYVENQAAEVQESTKNDGKYMDAAIRMNTGKGFVQAKVMEQAAKVRAKIAETMKRLEMDKRVALPEDVEGNTAISNSSYDVTEENTTICPRSLASEAFVDAVSEMLGRPLTVAEQLHISQDLQGRTLTPECLYCYVATDRKAYRAFLGSYVQQRDAVIKAYKDGNTDTSRSGSLYQQFLDGRKDTANMWKRFNLWINTYKSGKPMVQASHLANISKLMGDINAEFGADLKAQIKDAMAYAQSASWAKKRISYVAYNGHILRWKQDRINKLNSHYGLRMYSFSDFSPAFILENMQMITDAAVRGLKMLGYTKEIDFVKIFAKTGMNINVSTFGFEAGGNVYENNIIGANWAEAQKLREQYPNVGITFVATNDTLVEWALAQDWIDVVIPYHLVRTGAEVAAALNYKNYTSESSDVKDIGWKKGVDEKYIAPTVHNNDFATYMEALKKNHLKPRFERFIDNPNYMKLVNETRQSAAVSKPVQPIFDMEAATESLAKLEADGYYKPIGDTVERMYEIAAEVANKLEPEPVELADVQFMSRTIESVTRETVIQDLTEVYNGINVASASYIPIAKNTPFAVRYATKLWEDLPVIVDKKKAYFDMRPDGKFKEDKNHHYHDMGIDGYVDALKLLEDPDCAIAEPMDNGTTHYAFISENENGEELCVVFQMGVTKKPSQMNGYPGQYYNLDITEFVATDEWLEAHGVEEGVSYRDFLLSFPENSLVYDKKLNGEQLEKARNVDSESAGLAASFINNRAFKDTVPQAKAKVKTEDAQKSDHLTDKAIERNRTMLKKLVESYDISKGWAKTKHTELTQELNDLLVKKHGVPGRHSQLLDALNTAEDKLDEARFDGANNATIKKLEREVADAEKALDEFASKYLVADDFLLDDDLLFSDRATSLTRADRTHLDAVRRGDMEAARKMVENAAKKAGYTVKAYHGTPINGITVFDQSKIGTTTDEGIFGRGFYFTTNKLTADGYANVDGKTMPVFLKVKKPWWGTGHKLDEVAEKLNLSSESLTVIKVNKHASVVSPMGSYIGVFTSHLKENGYDSVVVQHGSHDYEIVIFDNTNIKSADPVTYDDDGNVIPLSERFSTENEDIRYSDRLTEPSTREVLATALEGTAKTELEQKVISEYIDTIPKLNEQEAKLNELNAQIREMSFGKGPRDAKKLNQLKTEAAKTRNRINILDKKLLRIESTVPLQRVIETEKAKAVKREKARSKEALAAAKERSAQKIAEVRKAYQESRANSVAGRRKTEMRHKVQRVVKQLNDLLLHETKEKHIPKSLKKAVADALDFVNMDTVGAEERIAKYEAMIAKETDPAKIDAYTATIENIRRQGERSGEMLNALKDAYKEISKSNDPEIMNAYDAEIYGNLAELAATIGNTSLRDMTIEQLQDVYSMYRMVLTTVQNANKLFREGRKETLVQLTQKVYNEIDAVPHKERDLPPALHKVQRWLRNFSWNELRPVDAFDRVGSKEFTELFWDIIKAQGEYGHMVEEVMDFMTTARKKHNYSKWDLTKATTYDTVNGKQFNVTLEDAMSIYAYSKRDQAHDHMTDGGFTYDTGRTYKDEKNGRKVSPVLSTPYRVTDVEIGEIIGSLTKEQRAYVDEVQQFLTDFGKKGNVVSNALWGIDLFTEKMYFPLKSSKDYRSSTEQALNATQTMVSLKNNGMTKATVPHANNPIVLRAFDDVVLEHLDTMSKYAAYVLPVENIQRVFNSVAKNSNEDYVSIQSLLTSVFGDSATAYFNQYIKDINGNTASTGAQSPIGSFFSKSKAAAVAANLSVVIQQYSSIVRAMAEIHPKFFNWFNPPTKTTLKTYEEIKKYAGVAVIKEMGGFDVSSNRGIKDFVGFEEAPASREKAWKKFQDITGWGAQQMDKVGWNTIWRAVKREVTASGKFKVGSEEFYQECGRRFTEVVTKTQVYDSVNSRSGFMRSKSDSVKYLTTYMGEPTVTVGMVFRSHLNLVRAVQSKQGVGAAAKNLARTGAVLACTMMLNAALKSVAYAMRDDDEDEAFIERWAKSVGDSVKNDLNIFNMLPVFRDIMSVIDGWDVERPDMSVITEMINATRTFVKPFLDEEKMEQMEPTDWWNNSVKLVGAIGNMVGVPLKNIIRDTTGVVRLYGDITDELKPEDVGGAFARGFTGKEQSKAESLYDAIVAGEDSRLEFLRTTYDNEAEYEKAVKNALRDNDERIEAAAEARYSGNWSEYERIFGEIEADGNFTRSQIAGAVESAMRDLEPEEVAGEVDVKNYGIYNKNDFAVAVFSGDKKSAEKIRNEIVKFMVAEGKTKDEATKSLDSFIRDSVKDWLETGDVDRNEAISALTQLASYDSKKATVKVDYWMYAMDHPGTYVSEDMISSYYEYGKPAGISMDVYVNYRNKIRGIEGEGKKENILPIINSMPISNAQKDALYFSHGWAKSRLSEAPWH